MCGYHYSDIVAQIKKVWQEASLMIPVDHVCKEDESDNDMDTNNDVHIG